MEGNRFQISEEERSSSSLAKRVRWIPLVVSATGYVMGFSLLFYAAEESLRNVMNLCRTPCVSGNEILSVARYCLLLPAASTGTSSVITGLKAVKALCEQGFAGAKNVIVKSVQKNGLIRDAILPTPRRVMTLTIQCAGSEPSSSY